jgi:hypothetical protein
MLWIMFDLYSPFHLVFVDPTNPPADELEIDTRWRDESRHRVVVPAELADLIRPLYPMRGLEGHATASAFRRLILSRRWQESHDLFEEIILECLEAYFNTDIRVAMLRIITEGENSFLPKEYAEEIYYEYNIDTMRVAIATSEGLCGVLVRAYDEARTFVTIEWTTSTSGVAPVEFIEHEVE